MKFSWKIWLLIITLICAALVIAPNFEKGVIIKSVEKNSTAFDSGLRNNMIIKTVNGKTIDNFEDYTKTMETIFPVENKTSLKINTRDTEFILYTDEAPKITISDIPKTKIKTGLDLSGGARALVKPENVSISSSEINDLIAILITGLMNSE